MAQEETPPETTVQQRVAELEQRLSDTEALYHTLTENIQEGVFIIQEGRLVFVNQVFAELIGYTVETLTGRPITDVIAPDDKEWVLDRYRRRQMGEDVPSTYTFRMLHQNGEQRVWVHMSVSVIVYQNKPASMGTVRDVTERQHQEAALQASEERSRAIIEKIPVGVCITNNDYRFEYVNPAYCEIYGYTPDELIGQPFTTVVPEANRKRMERLHDAFMEQQEEIRGEWEVEAKGGVPLTIMADAAAITGADGKPKKVTFVIDITEKRQAQQQSLDLQQQLIDAQQAAIRELSSPLIPLSRNVVLMPLIGSIDTGRAQLIMETLLEGVAHHQADTAIVDITGVSVVDTQVANALVQTAQAVRLLGAQVVLTGIGPTMAQTLVHLGADLSSIITRGSLQKGIAFAMQTTHTTNTTKHDEHNDDETGRDKTRQDETKR